MTECTRLGIKKHNSSCEKTLKGRPFWTVVKERKKEGGLCNVQKGLKERGVVEGAWTNWAKCLHKGGQAGPNNHPVGELGRPPVARVGLQKKRERSVYEDMAEQGQQ